MAGPSSTREKKGAAEKNPAPDADTKEENAPSVDYVHWGVSAILVAVFATALVRVILSLRGYSSPPEASMPFAADAALEDDPNTPASQPYMFDMRPVQSYAVVVVAYKEPYSMLMEAMSSALSSMVYCATNNAPSLGMPACSNVSGHLVLVQDGPLPVPPSPPSIPEEAQVAAVKAHLAKHRAAVSAVMSALLATVGVNASFLSNLNITVDPPVMFATNIGRSTTRNAGAAAAPQADTLLYLDGDDVYFPPHVSQRIAGLRADSALCYHRGLIKPLDLPPGHPGMHPTWVPRLSHTIPCALAIRRWCLDFAGGWRPKDHVYEDVYLMEVLSKLFPLKLDEESPPSSGYRWKAGSHFDRQLAIFTLSDTDGDYISNMVRPPAAGERDENGVLRPVVEKPLKDPAFRWGERAIFDQAAVFRRHLERKAVDASDPPPGPDEYPPPFVRAPWHPRDDPWPLGVMPYAGAARGDPAELERSARMGLPLLPVSPSVSPSSSPSSSASPSSSGVSSSSGLASSSSSKQDGPATNNLAVIANSTAFNDPPAVNNPSPPATTVPRPRVIAIVGTTPTTFGMTGFKVFPKWPKGWQHMVRSLPAAMATPSATKSVPGKGGKGAGGGNSVAAAAGGKASNGKEGGGALNGDATAAVGVAPGCRRGCVWVQEWEHNDMDLVVYLCGQQPNMPSPFRQTGVGARFVYLCPEHVGARFHWVNLALFDVVATQSPASHVQHVAIFSDPAALWIPSGIPPGRTAASRNAWATVHRDRPSSIVVVLWNQGLPWYRGEKDYGKNAFVSKLAEHVPIEFVVRSGQGGEVVYVREDGSTVESLDSFYSRFKFVLALEDTREDDLVTERLFWPLLRGAVPVYVGAPNVHDYLPHPDAAVVVGDYKDEQALAAHIERACRDPDVYAQHHRWRLEQEPVRKLRELMTTKGFLLGGGGSMETVTVKGGAGGAATRQRTQTWVPSGNLSVTDVGLRDFEARPRHRLLSPGMRKHLPRDITMSAMGKEDLWYNPCLLCDYELPTAGGAVQSGQQ